MPAPMKPIFIDIPSVGVSWVTNSVTDVVVAKEFLGRPWLATDELFQIIGLLRPLAGVHSLHPLERKFHDEGWPTFGELDLGVFLIRDGRVGHLRAVNLRKDGTDVGEGDGRIAGQRIRLVFVSAAGKDGGV